MKAIRIGLVIALVSSLALFAIPWRTPAKAQSGCTPQGSETWCIVYDYSSAQFGSSIRNVPGISPPDIGIWTSGQGYQARTDDNAGAGSAFFRRMIVEAPLPSAVTILRIKMTYHYNNGPQLNPGSNSGFYIIDKSGGVYGAYAVNHSMADQTAAHGASFSGSDTFTVSLTGLSALEYYMAVSDTSPTDTTSGDATIVSIEMGGTGTGIPTATPSPTPSPTPDTGGPLPTAAAYSPCPLMGDTNADFQNLAEGDAHWVLHGDAVTAYPNQGVDLHSSYVEQTLTLSRYKKYLVEVKYKQSVAHTDAIFFKLGNTPSIAITLTADTNEQTFDAPAANYEPTTLGTADTYDLIIGAQTVSLGNVLRVTYICVMDASAAKSKNPTVTATTCQACIYSPATINSLGDVVGNIILLLEWLWCGISQIWDCAVRPFFAFLSDLLNTIIQAIAFIRQWWGLITSNGSNWLASILLTLWNWLGGSVPNVIQTILNAAAMLFNSLGLGGIFNVALNFLAGIPTLIGLIGTWAQQLFTVILTVIGAIPILIGSVVAGFNTSASSIPVYAPDCTATNTILYGPCLGLYVLDNTVFAGPIYYLFPLTEGIVAINAILWGLDHVKKALSS